MKKSGVFFGKANLILAILVLAISMIFGGCGKDTESIIEQTDNFAYYLSADGTKIVRVSLLNTEFDLSGLSGTKAIDMLLKALSTAPKDPDIIATLSKETMLNDYTLEGGLLVLDFDNSYVNLSKTTEVLFRAALTRSFTAIKDIDSVAITIDGEDLLDSVGNSVGVMRADNFIDNPGDEMNAYEQTRVALYFADSDGKALVKENRDVVYSSNISTERLVLEELLKGPEKSDHLATLSGDRTVISVTTKDGICYVNLSEKPIEQAGLFSNISEEITLYSIVNSLCELPEINKVSISIEGDSNRMFILEYPLETLYERNLDIVK